MAVHIEPSSSTYLPVMTEEAGTKLLLYHSEVLQDNLNQLPLRNHFQDKTTSIPGSTKDSQQYSLIQTQ